MGGTLGSNIGIAETDKTKFMISSIMEEAISSSQMEGANRTNLQVSQTAWEVYKKAQYRFLENYYGSMEGTMYKQIMVSEKIDVLKRRFPELYNLTQD